MMVRSPAVAGQFYPDKKTLLKEMLLGLIPSVDSVQSFMAVMSPHAGYIYSGRVAGQTFSDVGLVARVEEPPSPHA